MSFSVSLLSVTFTIVINRFGCADEPEADENCVEGGQFEGPRLHGKILPGGGDWEIVQPDSTAYLDTRYNLQTHDGATIYLQTRGVRKGKKNILDKLGEDTNIKADEYSCVSFRPRVQST